MEIESLTILAFLEYPLKYFFGFNPAFMCNSIHNKYRTKQKPLYICAFGPSAPLLTNLTVPTPTHSIWQRTTWEQQALPRL